MSAQEQTCYTLVCDECREAVYEFDDGCPYHYDDAEDLRRDAESYGDWSRDGDRDFCPSCTCKHSGHRQKIGGSGFVYCDRCAETLLDSITVPANASYL